MNIIDWIQTEVFPAAAQANSFGDDFKFVRFEPDPQQRSDQYVSDITFGDVVLESKTGEIVKERVIVKYQTTEGLPALDFHNHFYNELVFYTEVIPLFRKYDTDNFLTKNVPEYVYGHANMENPKENVMILKDLNTKGFQMTAERLFLDEKHIQLVMETIAKYHALSIRCQREDPEGFKDLLSKIEVEFFKNPEEPVDGKHFWEAISYRGIDYLKSDPKYEDKLGDLSKHCDKSVYFMNKSLLPSKEGINVLVHGDFTRNNFLYRYDADGQPKEIIFLDWGLVKYCTPAVDLSLFLMLNTSPEMKQLHWDDFLRTYHSTLSRQLEGLPAVPSLEDVELEVRKKGVYGYHWCSLFIPLGHGTKGKEAIRELDSVQWTRYFLESGGEKVTEYLSKLVKHMLEKNFIFEKEFV